MNQVKQTQLAVIKALLIFNVVMIIGSFIVSKAPFPFITGLIFGSLISVLNFVELANTLQRAVQMAPDKAQAFTASKYMLRMVIAGVVLYVSIVAPYINVLGTVIGLTAIKPMIFATNLFNDRTFFKNIFIRKEDESNGQ